MLVTLTKVSRKERESAKGRAFISLGIQTEEHGDKWLSGFGNASNASWVPGQKVAIEITEKGDYLNFVEASVWDAIADLDKRIRELQGNADVKQQSHVAKQQTPKEPELEIEDLPF